MAAPRQYIVDLGINYPSVEDEYYVELLRLILNASKAPNEVIEFTSGEAQASQARWISAVVQNKGNGVLWTMSSKERENTLRAIRVPIFKGLMGYRLIVIRSQDQAKFAAVNTKEELRALVAGQGLHWPDTDILRANNIDVKTAGAKENLYKMLTAKRFDFFPRGSNEVYLENNLIHANHHIVEPHLILHYPVGIYFFVRKDNIELAERIEKGWKVIRKNGDFERYFLQSEQVKAALLALKSSKRTVIELDNPFIDVSELKDTPDYWLDLSAIP